MWMYRSMHGVYTLNVKAWPVLDPPFEALLGLNLRFHARYPVSTLHWESGMHVLITAIGLRNGLRA